jgi:hypothetical protein
MSEESGNKSVFNQPNWKVDGNVIQAAGNAYVNEGGSVAGLDALVEAFAALATRVEALPKDDQKVLKPIVEQAKDSATKIQQGNESPEMEEAFEKRLRSLVAMAPDIGEVFLATLANPAAGVALALSKIAAKVRGSAPGAPSTVR